MTFRQCQERDLAYAHRNRNPVRPNGQADDPGVAVSRSDLDGEPSATELPSLDMNTLSALAHPDSG
jgi:hypothetical protein